MDIAKCFKDALLYVAEFLWEKHSFASCYRSSTCTWIAVQSHYKRHETHAIMANELRRLHFE